MAEAKCLHLLDTFSTTMLIQFPIVQLATSRRAIDANSTIWTKLPLPNADRT